MAGSVAGFDHARVSKPVFLGFLWAFTAVSLLFVTFRIFVRIRQFRRLFIDDGFVLLSWVIMLTTAISWQIEGQTLYKFYAIAAGTEPYTLSAISELKTFLKFIAPLTIFFYTSLWCIKFSFLAFFLRLDSKVKSHRIWWYIVLFVTIGVYFSSVGDIDYRCSVGSFEYIEENCSDLKHVHFQNRTFWANCAGDVITDIMILSIPFLMLWNTRISKRNKIVLFSVFSVTVIVMLVSIIRVVVNVSLDKSVDVSWLYFWSFIEMGTAIIISCVASFRQLFVTSQNQHLYGQGNKKYTPYRNLLKSGTPRQADSTTLVNSDMEAQGIALAVPSVPTPLSSAHFRDEFEVITTNTWKNGDVRY
ncbi:hypothetical protein N7493_001313 [Penicillium malachiteum]|uniref:Rhodopsin domain-containing protein n=1 Tax=Penicillium malachiteum TaxID=1324776 RepID=A0AAD6HUN5_9EURO|nr:hypothetical protein N7493_001313 [Penicillium malachiteum]